MFAEDNSSECMHRFCCATNPGDLTADESRFVGIFRFRRSGKTRPDDEAVEVGPPVAVCAFRKDGAGNHVSGKLIGYNISD